MAASMGRDRIHHSKVPQGSELPGKSDYQQDFNLRGVIENLSQVGSNKVRIKSQWWADRGTRHGFLGPFDL